MQDSKKDTDVYKRLLDSEGEGGMIWENGIETCMLSCKNRITSLCPMQDTACLGLVHSDDPERCYGEGGGRAVHVWERMLQCHSPKSSHPLPLPLSPKAPYTNCCFLTCIQISQEADQLVWYSYVFKNFPQFVEIHTVKGCKTG